MDDREVRTLLDTDIVVSRLYVFYEFPSENHNIVMLVTSIKIFIIVGVFIIIIIVIIIIIIIDDQNYSYARKTVKKFLTTVSMDWQATEPLTHRKGPCHSLIDTFHMSAPSKGQRSKRQLNTISHRRQTYHISLC